MWLPLPLTSLASTPEFQLLFEGESVSPHATGVWQSTGYGWILTLSGRHMVLYHYSSAGCLKDEATTEDLGLLARYFAREETRLWLTSRQEDATIYPFDQMDELPSSCQAGIENTPKQVFDYFWSVMDQNYAFFDLYNVDWHARKEQYASAISENMGEKELFHVLSDMMEGLEDGHLELRAEIEGDYHRFRASRTRVLGAAIDTAFANQRKIKDRSEFINKWFFGTLKNVKKKILKRSRREAAGGTFVWGKIDNLGYLAIYAMEEFDDENEGFEDQLSAAHRIMNQVVSDLADTDKLIVDITLNQGGMDELSMAVASHFTDEPVLAFTKVAHASGVAPQEFYIKPAESGMYLKPVTLMTSGVTLSAAEVFTIAMRALPHVTHVGGTTDGALSDVLEKPLPNQWQLLLSNEIYRDAEGHLWEGEGVPPVEYIQIFDPYDMDMSVLNAIRTVAESIK